MYKTIIENAIRRIEALGVEFRFKSPGIEHKFINRFCEKLYEKTTSPNTHIHMTLLLHRRHGIICFGFNHGKTHSEVDALNRYRQTCKKWHHLGVGLWNARVTRSGKLALSEPCFHCSVFIKRHLRLLSLISFTVTDCTARRLSPADFISSSFVHVCGRHNDAIRWKKITKNIG
jgi:hypothetical protein